MVQGIDRSFVLCLISNRWNAGSEAEWAESLQGELNQLVRRSSS